MYNISSGFVFDLLKLLEACLTSYDLAKGGVWWVSMHRYRNCAIILSLPLGTVRPVYRTGLSLLSRERFLFI